MPETNNTLLPNLICPGAQRSGTSYLHTLLSQHGDIFGATAKEVHYFDINIGKGPEWYGYHFRNASGYRYRLDTTPEYMVIEEIPRDILRLLGKDVKFIFMLRNPADRAFSEYMSIPVHREGRTFEDYIAPKLQAGYDTPVYRSDKIYYCIRRGFYARRIRAFMEFFPIGNMFFVKFEDFISNPEETLRGICGFLDIPYDSSIIYDRGRNQSKYTDRKAIHRLDMKLQGFYRYLSSRISIGMKENLKTVREKVKGMKPRENETINPETAAQLIRIYSDDIKELGEITGIDFRDWIEKYS